MKRFEWRRILRSGSISGLYPAIVEITSPSTLRFWGILDKQENKYSPKLLNKDRTGYITIQELLSFSDAKDAIEKKLFDDGIIQDGDELIDYCDTE